MPLGLESRRLEAISNYDHKVKYKHLSIGNTNGMKTIQVR